MKTSSLTVLLLVLWVARSQAQTPDAPMWTGNGGASRITPPSPSVYQVVSNSADQQVWQMTVTTTNAAGQVIKRVHKYDQLATGLNHWQNGKWVESKEEVDVLGDGTAAATNGQHQAYYPGDIYQGTIRLVTPDGRQMQSQPIGLSYDDGSNLVMIAELTNSVGSLADSNQVIYADAFSGIKADLLYTYRKDGFEQDIILRQQPPTPQSLGLNAATTRLQVLTEFFDAPTPVTTSGIQPGQGGASESDQMLNFGTMTMIPGRAFLLESGTNINDSAVSVGKRWVEIDGRQILVEEVPVSALANDMSSLPLFSKGGTNAYHNMASNQRRLPARHLAKMHSPGNSLRLARITSKSDRGLVLDYNILISNYSDYTFRGDTTYLLSGDVGIYGTAIIEGGTVIKYDYPDVECGINFWGPVKCQTEAYRPAIFTLCDDDSVGETIAGSDGSPAMSSPNGYGGPWGLAFNTSDPFDVHDLQIRYLSGGMGDGWTNDGKTNTVRDCQFYSVYSPIGVNGAAAGPTNRLNVRNVLVRDAGRVFIDYNEESLSAENLTVQNCQILFQQGGSETVITLDMTNCIMVGVTNWEYGGGIGLNCVNCGITQCSPTNSNIIDFIDCITNDSLTGVFQTAGAGALYLPTNSLYLGIGNTNINPTLLASLSEKTTRAPVDYSNVVFSTSTLFATHVPLDTNSNPDLGYHYPPLDYVLNNCSVTNTTLTISNGVSIATYGNNGLQLLNGGQIISIGSPLAPNLFVRSASVQETPCQNTNNFLTDTSDTAGGLFRFTKFSCPAGSGYDLYHAAGSVFGSLDVQDCEFWGGANDLSGAATNTVALLKNNFFWRSSLYASNTSAQAGLFLTNNTFWGTTVTLQQPAGGQWSAFNNNFDSGTVIGTLTNGYNAYLNDSGRLYPTNQHDFISTNSQAYQSGPLGDYYLPPNCALLNTGNTNANLLGLYQFTTQTNQVKETNSIVDIGYHYVAVDAYGNPIDSNGDGIPDYLEDANGDGLVDNGEMNWALAISQQPTNQTILQYSNVTFSVTAVGITPLHYKWYFNGTNLLLGETNTSLTITNVQPTNAGNYSVVVTNIAGSVVSSNAVLIVLSWTVDADYDGRNDAQEIIDGTDPFNPDSVLQVRLGYWPYDNTNTWVGSAGQLPLQATNVIGVPSWSTNAVLIDSTNSVILTYRDMETNGNANINLRCGTLRFWFRPDWSSTTEGGTGPHAQGRLIEMGMQGTNAGWWTLLLDTNGDTLSFITQTNGACMTNLAASISWTSNQWYQMVLTYSPTSCGLYVDGQLVVNGAGVVYYPSTIERANGFEIGSDASGGNPAGGVFDELETFNYPLEACAIQSNFMAELPSIVQQPMNETVVHGSNAVFSVTATSAAPLSYQWYSNSVPISGANASILTLYGVQTNSADYYYVVVANGISSVASSSAGLTVLMSPVIVAQPSNVVAAVGQAVSFSVSANGGGAPDGSTPLDYQWYYNSNAIIGANSSNLILNNVQTNDAGNYFVKVANILGSLNSSNVTLTIVSPPAIIEQPTNQVVMAGETAVFNVSLSDNGPFFYQWLFNGTVLVVSNIIRTVAGDYSGSYVSGLGWGYSGDGGAATNATLNFPSAVAMDGSDNLYIADTYNSVIRKVDTSGIITTVAGNYGLSSGYSGDGGAATNAALAEPSGVAADGVGNIYIADTYNSVIRKVDIGGIITTVAGNYSLYPYGGYWGDGGVATNAALDQPSSVTVDGSGNLYIADTYNDVVRKVDTNNIITTVAGNYSLGSGYSGDGGAATNATLNFPSAVAVDGSDNLYIADTYNSVIRKVDTSGIITTVAGNYGLYPYGGYSGGGGVATNVALNYPDAVTVDGMGNLYISDTGNTLIRKVNANGIITTVAGNYSLDGAFGDDSGDGGVATNAVLCNPYGLAVDSFGNLYIADLYNSIIRKVTYCPPGVNVDGTGTLTIYNAQPDMAGNYQLVVSNSFGSVTSSIVSLAVDSWLADSDYDGRNNGQEIVDSTDPFNPDSVLRVRLGYWRFDNTNTWAGDAGQLPFQTTNVVGVPSWSTNAVLIDNTNGVVLTYRDVETNGIANINLRSGTVRLWFKPDWSSTNVSGNGPGYSGRLFEVGNYNPAFTNGWWSLYFSPDGSQLSFGSSTNGAGGVNLSANIAWISNRWHQVVLTYSPTNSILYVDGQLLTNGQGSIYYPNVIERSSGFRIGSDVNGTNQARGAFDELDTFNYPLDSGTVSTNYQTTIQWNTGTNGLPNIWQMNNFGYLGVDPNGDPDGDHLNNLQEYQYGTDPNNPDTDGDGRTDWEEIFDNTKPLIASSKATWLVVADKPNTGLHANLTSPSPSLFTWNSGGTNYFGVTNGEANVFYDVFGKTNLLSPTWFWYGHVMAGAQYLLVDPTKSAVFYILGGDSYGDADNDGLADGYEYYVTKTDYNNPDSDYDGRSDGQEVLLDGTDPNNATSVTNVMLAYWRFNNTNSWIGEQGQLPMLATNVVGIPSWGTNAVRIDTNAMAILKYHDVEPTNYAPANINCRKGTVQFWFAPDWSSGIGPGTKGRLIEMGSQTPTTGWWSLYFNTNGSQLIFGTQTNGLAVTNLTASINWASNYWHQIVLTYSLTNSSLYVDGLPVVTNGLGTTNFPNQTERSNGFGIGSDYNGTNQARGVFDELQTYNYPLSATIIATNYQTMYQSLLQSDINGDGIPDIWEMNNFGTLNINPNADPDGDGLSNYQEYLNGTNPNIPDNFGMILTEPKANAIVP